MKKVIAVLLVVLLCLSLTGCSPKPDYIVQVGLAYYDIDEDSINSISNAIGGESEEDQEDILDEESAEFLTKMFGNLEYKIISTETNGDKATVKVEIKNIDMGTVMANYFSRALSYAFSADVSDEAFDQELEKILIEELDAAVSENKTITKTVDVPLKKTDDGWEVEMTLDFADALTGGMATSLEDY